MSYMYVLTIRQVMLKGVVLFYVLLFFGLIKGSATFKYTVVYS